MCTAGCRRCQAVSCPTQTCELTPHSDSSPHASYHPINTQSLLSTVKWWCFSYLSSLSPQLLLLRPGRGVEYCDQLVCLGVCLSVSISLVPLDWSSQNFVCRSLWPWLSSPLAVLRCYVLLVLWMTSRNGRDTEKWRLHSAATAMSSVAISGQSLMSMNAC